ncbi:hypothetical protein [Maritimibacter alkaliphilus]|uniref:hypothetical protein n=1 Tax=Maritimibacter alkaliphilus TaxID=404236 RepID=UPI001C9433B7|nr:hypothetical protein [Maritimibacter alkaliphilus]MBY6088959.1 hypothetical protein [Maritimibacter alkaliphilus]
MEQTKLTPGTFDLADAIDSTPGFGVPIWGGVSTAARGWSDGAALSVIVVGLLIIEHFAKTAPMVRNAVGFGPNSHCTDVAKRGLASQTVVS